MLATLLRDHEIAVRPFCRVFKIVNVSGKRNENGSNWRGHATWSKSDSCKSVSGSGSGCNCHQIPVAVALAVGAEVVGLCCCCVAWFLYVWQLLYVTIFSISFYFKCKIYCHLPRCMPRLQLPSPRVPCWVAQSGYRLISGNVRLFVVWLFSCSSVLLLLLLLLPCLAFTRRQQKTFAFSRPLEMSLN